VAEGDLSHIESELKGKTLLVYWYFLRQGDARIGVRAVQRALDFSSPSVAFHHMEKLRRLGLLDKNPLGEYRLVGEVKVGLLRHFVRWGRILLPRHLFYAVMFTCMIVTYVVVYPQSLSNVHNLVALIFGVVACLIFWYEALKIRRDAPF
jgi:hypothetical protein